ncbi:anti-sigma factor family protein [Thermogemmatispora sp.]|uniref:anti-sigma factor family protein n=1 Tax=Thermogemmatispora sp. TaxID=1968838 RepID=UPI0035E4026B
MAQDHQEHPTLEQLSAYLDGALSSEEETFCAAHLPHCAACRSELASLRLTRELLRALPPARPPRTFTLTPELLRTSPPAAEPEVNTLATSTGSEGPAASSAGRSGPQSEPMAGAGTRRSPLRRLVRVMSTLAAVIALALLLSALLASVSGGFSGSTSTAVQVAPVRPPASSPEAQQHAAATPATSSEVPRGMRPGLTGTPAPAEATPPGYSPWQLPNGAPAFSLTAFLLAPLTRLLLGCLLLIAALAGLLLTRQPPSSAGRGFDRTTTRPR